MSESVGVIMPTSNQGGIVNRVFISDSSADGDYLKEAKKNKYDFTTGNEDGKDVATPEGADDDEGGTGRPVWGRSIEFLLSCISMSVGLGNIWRFPFTAYENGGGAFLIPYVIILFLVGKPMYYLEMILGQFSSRSSVKIWSICPLLRGIGIGQMIATVSVITYYSSLLAFCLHYLFSSFSADLPWTKCDPDWGPECVNSKPSENETAVIGDSNSTRISSSELYFLKHVLKEKDDISDGIGSPDWKLSLWLLLAWVCVLAIIVKGVRSAGKASYFLAIFPYVILIILLVRAVTLPGAVDGILYFITPQFDKLLSPKVWYAATTQLFFSLNIGMSTIVMLSSYNRFSHNIYRDAVIVTSMDTFTSLLGGITIFAILGNLAHNLGVTDISKVVKSGSGLAFISYPDAISKIDVVPQLFSVLFFFMLFVLGVGSLVALTNAVITVIWDQFTKIKYWQVSVGVCILGYFSALIYITPGGQWMLNLVDHFGGTFLIFVLAIGELIGVMWIYGLEHFCNDVQFMIGQRPGWYWRVCWLILTPILMVFVFIYSMATLEPLLYAGKEYPDSAYIAGWAYFGLGVIQIPLWAIWTLDSKRSLCVSVREGFKAKPSWGPKSPRKHQSWRVHKANLKLARDERVAKKYPNVFLRYLNIVFGKYV